MLNLSSTPNHRIKQPHVEKIEVAILNQELKPKLPRHISCLETSTYSQSIWGNSGVQQPLKCSLDEDLSRREATNLVGGNASPRLVGTCGQALCSDKLALKDTAPHMTDAPSNGNCSIPLRLAATRGLQACSISEGALKDTPTDISFRTPSVSPVNILKYQLKDYTAQQKHLANLLNNLRYRLTVANAKGNRELVDLLQKEFTELATNT